MNITTKIIITDTNVISDLSNAKVLDKFVNLNNVYMSDMVKHDEINSSSGDVKVINKFKTIKASAQQIIEMYSIVQKQKPLSKYDSINYILARDNNAILATGDRKLREFSESNGITVIRTLGIIEFMESNGIISTNEAINACNSLKNEKSTRIPHSDIDNLITKLKKNLVSC